jgi:hypothetical protein
MHVNNRGVLRCSRVVSISCYTSGNCRVTNPVINHACGKDQEDYDFWNISVVIYETHMSSSHVGDRNTFEAMT